eukprot:1156924-Pelagomonas_calceolata.AAC.1
MFRSGRQEAWQQSVGTGCVEKFRPREKAQRIGPLSEEGNDRGPGSRRICARHRGGQLPYVAGYVISRFPSLHLTKPTIVLNDVISFTKT